MIKLTDILNEGKISSDIEKIGKKVGIKFKKITNDITTNKFSNPTVMLRKWVKTTKELE